MKKENEDSEDLFRTIFGVISDAVFIADREYRLLEVNDAACRQLGYSREELLRKTMKEVVCATFWQGFEDRSREAHGRLEYSEGRTLRKNGTKVEVEIAVRRVCLKGRQVLLFIARDITEQKRSEAALRESEGRYKSIFKHSAVSLWEGDISLLRSALRELRSRGIDDIEGFLQANPSIAQEMFELINVVDVNDASLKLFEVEKKEDLLGPLNLYFDKEASTNSREMVRLVAEGQNHVELETSVITGRGRKRDIWVSASLPDGIGTHQNLLVNVLDMTERRRAEHALRASEARYRRLYESMMDAFVSVEMTGRIKECNEAYREMLGYGMQELATMSYQDLTPSKWHRAENAIIRDQVMVRGYSDIYEKEYIRKDGAVFPVELRVFLLKDDAGRSSGMWAIVRDISERKRVEEILRENERTLATLISNLPGMIYRRRNEREGAIEFISDGCLALTGYEVEDFIPNTVLAYENLILPEDREAVRRGVSEAIAERRSYELTYRIKTAADEVKWVWERGRGIWENGEILFIEGFVTDITGSKRTELALQTAKEYAENLIQTANAIVVGLDLQGKVTALNQAAEQITGYSRAELEDRDMFELIVPRYRYPRVWEMFERLTKEGLPRNFETPILTKSGEERYVVWQNNEVREEGKIVGSISFGIDITERIRAEEERRSLGEQLAQAQKMESIGRLAGGVAHDFNNLLTGIIGNISLAILDLDLRDPMYSTLMEIDRSAQSAAALTRQLLAFSRKELVRPKVIDLNEHLESMRKMLERVIGEDVKLCAVLREGLWLVKVDPGQVEQIVVNLAVNARDAMPEGGELVVETGNITVERERCVAHGVPKPGPYVMIEVRDTGGGMTDEVKRHLFEPFFTTKERGKGTGLGLAMVYGVVQQNQGGIEVESEVGKGTVVRIFLPRSQEEPMETVRPHTVDDTPRGTETVLLVEDEPLVRNLAGRLLERLGYKVISCGNGSEAIKASDDFSGPIHLLLTDVVMPGINGRDLALTLTRSRPRLKTLFTSGYTDEVISHRGLLEVGTHFISKPFTSQSLAREVRHVLDDEELKAPARGPL